MRRDDGEEAPGGAERRLGRREDDQESPQSSDWEHDVFRNRFHESRDGENGERGRGGARELGGKGGGWWGGDVFCFFVC